MIARRRRANPAAAWLALLLLALAPVGCVPALPIDEDFDESRGDSINGTSALAEMFRQAGHKVRTSERLNDRVEEWADVLVRFSPEAGPPDATEGARLLDWLDEGSDRRLIFVPRDYDAGPEFWAAMLAAQGPGRSPAWTAQVERNRAAAATRAAQPAKKSPTPAPAVAWFDLRPNPGAATVAASLRGPWAEGVDAAAARVAVHETFADAGEDVLLADGDGGTLAMSWTLDGTSRILAVANASFLLNGALANRARWPLAERVVGWAGDPPRKVVFLDDDHLFGPGGSDGPPGMFHLLGIYPFDWIAAHLAVLGLAAALARAVRLGRPRPEPPSGADRPAAHPEALGGLLARTRREDAARELLEAYRRWRHPSATPAAHQSPPSTPLARKHRS